MSFTSIAYLLFFPSVVCMYWGLSRVWQNRLLLAASYFFLCYVHLWFGVLIFMVTAVNYGCSIAMTRWPQKRKAFLVLAVLLCFADLAYFKYASFFLENISFLFNSLGVPFSQPVLSIMLPVGISFYTFQGLAYTIDVYRGNTEPCYNLIDFSLFIAFFPQLVAGPIERSRDLLPQICSRRQTSPESVQQGILLLLWGFFKKLVIADNCGLIAFKVFALTDPSFYLLWSGVFAFGIQILADFWSYTDIARGSALLLGFKLSRNFDHPYFAKSPADFWRRWHMTLSYWLRDYVYIPLGGSRSPSPIRRGINIMLTFLISGLWHGANWNFVIWGSYHGLLVLLDRLCRRTVATFRALLPSPFQTPFSFLQIALTFLLINIGWLFFRESHIHVLLGYLSLTPWTSTQNDNQIALYLFSLTMVYALPIFCHGVLYFGDKKIRGLQEEYSRNILLFRPLLAAGLLLGILTLRSPEPATFIYFQF